MPRRRRRRRGDERGRRRYPHHGTLSSRGRWSPKDNDLASAAAATVRTVLSSRIPRLPISFTPRFPHSSPRPSTWLPFPSPPLSSSFPPSLFIRLSIFSWEYDTAENIFFFYREPSMEETPCRLLRSAERTTESTIRRRLLLYTLNLSTLHDFADHANLFMNSRFNLFC